MDKKIDKHATVVWYLILGIFTFNTLYNIVESSLISMALMVVLWISLCYLTRWIVLFFPKWFNKRSPKVKLNSTSVFHFLLFVFGGGYCLIRVILELF